MMTLLNSMTGGTPPHFQEGRTIMEQSFVGNQVHENHLFGNILMMLQNIQMEHQKCTVATVSRSLHIHQIGIWGHMH